MHKDSARFRLGTGVCFTEPSAAVKSAHELHCYKPWSKYRHRELNLLMTRILFVKAKSKAHAILRHLRGLRFVAGNIVAGARKPGLALLDYSYGVGQTRPESATTIFQQLHFRNGCRSTPNLARSRKQTKRR